MVTEQQGTWTWAEVARDKVRSDVIDDDNAWQVQHARLASGEMYVKTIEGVTIKLTIPWNPDLTTQPVKILLQETLTRGHGREVHKDLQRLICRGKELDDERTLRSYDIKPTGTLP